MLVSSGLILNAEVCEYENIMDTYLKSIQRYRYQLRYGQPIYESQADPVFYPLLPPRGNQNRRDERFSCKMEIKIKCCKALPTAPGGWRQLCACDVLLSKLSI